MKNLTTLILLLTLVLSLKGQEVKNALLWPEVSREAKPWTRWWWLGSAVDSASLTYRLEEMSKAGMGGVEITPIYGVKGFETKFIPFLSPRWMNMVKHTINEGNRLQMGIDMNTGTGWPFGGPEITPRLGASRYILQVYPVKGNSKLTEPVIPKDSLQRRVAILQALMAFSEDGKSIDLMDSINNTRQLSWTAPVGNWKVYALFNGRTLQKVKRAAPGGEGLVMDHYSQVAVNTYLDKFTQAFGSSGSPSPHNFFNDSYEVYGADWTNNFLREFRERRGYKLEDYLPAFNGEGNKDLIARVWSDYRETISDLLMDYFTKTWTDWAHERGSLTRNQAHGSPGNLLDLYSTVDVPECETFGTSKFDIPGLRRDNAEIRKSDSSPFVQKLASSAAHITGKKYTSCETFTWLSEHFKTSLSQCKPELDQVFLSGINHVYFHGTPYSPKDAPWPGWQFYAAVNFSSYNTFWRDIRAFNEYIARCQSFLQEGQPDNDFLIYWPVYDVWYNVNEKPYLSFEIHSYNKWLTTSSFNKVAETIRNKGYSFDFISDKLIQTASASNGMINTPGSTYKALVIPPAQFIPAETMEKIAMLVKAGAKVLIVDQIPADVPGFGNLEKRRAQLKAANQNWPSTLTFETAQKTRVGSGTLITGKNIDQMLDLCELANDSITSSGLKYIRRSTPEGAIYFIVNQQQKYFDGWISLRTNASSVAIFDPLTGNSGLARIKKENNCTKVYLQLKSDESVILKTWNSSEIKGNNWIYYQISGIPISINEDWQLSFPENPANHSTYKLDSFESWTNLKDSSLRSFSGTGKYIKTIDLPNVKADEWLLRLGDVRESARVIVNGQPVATLWAIPFETYIGKYLKKGKNTIEIEVTNLPANRIADYDRKKIEWRIFYEINFVNVFYKSFDASGWQPTASGLLGPVRLIPVKKMQ